MGLDVTLHLQLCAVRAELLAADWANLPRRLRRRQTLKDQPPRVPNLLEENAAVTLEPLVHEVRLQLELVR